MNTADIDANLLQETPSSGPHAEAADRSVPARLRIPALRHRLASSPNSAPHWLQLGFGFLDLGDPRRAEPALRAALQIQPALHVARAGLARALTMQGRCIEAVQECQEGLAMSPANMQLHQALAESLMQAGLVKKANEAVRAAVAANDGVESSALLAAFHFWQNRTGECLRILDKVLEKAPQYAAARQLQHRAQAATARRASVAGSMLPDPRAQAPGPWQAYLQSWKGLKVGLAWADHRPLADTLLRSIALTEFAPLAGLPGVTFFSLQQGRPAREIAQPPENLECVPLSDALSDPSEMVGVLRQMDLVITVDGELARAAAELGCRTWVLLPAQASAFWGRMPREVPAFPNVRLFRQQRRGHWQNALREAAAALHALASTEIAHGLDAVQRQLLEAMTACEKSRLPKAGRIYRGLLAGRHERRDQINHAVRQYMARCNRYDFSFAAPPVEIGTADALRAHTDLTAWILARNGKRKAAFAIWQKLMDNGMPALNVLMHYGDEAQQERDWKRASDIWEKAMALYPDASQPPLRAAHCYREQGRIGMAIACLQRSLALSPCQPEAHLDLGRLLQRQDQNEQALRHLQLAVFLDPGHADAWLHLGHLLYGMGRHHASAVCFEQAHTLAPSHYAALHFGYSAFSLQKYEWAISLLDEALRYEPKHQDALFYKARALVSLDRHNEAAEVLAAMRSMNPVAFDANDLYRKNLFVERLWQAHKGVETPNDVYWSARTPAGTRWRGEPLQGKTLLVFQDAGFGDSLQAARYLSRLKRDFGAGKVIFAVWPELVRLYRGMPAVDEVHSIFDIHIEKLACDFHVDEYSLLLLAVVAVGPAPEAGFYLKANPDLAAGWQARLSADRKFRIGITWAGSAGHPNDSNRSLSLRDLLPLSDLPDVSFYALQKGPAVAQIGTLPDFRVMSLDADLHDFADTAALMSTLDLVISVDSSPAHLAGALGVPVWVLVPAVQTDWRWDKEKSSTPWYPSMRLFHRSTGESWRDVVLRVRRELVHLCGSARPPRIPDGALSADVQVQNGES